MSIFRRKTEILRGSTVCQVQSPSSVSSYYTALPVIKETKIKAKHQTDGDEQDCMPFPIFFFFSHFFYSKYWVLSKSEKKLIIFLDKEINSWWKNIIHGQFLEKGKEHLQEELD